MKLKNLKSLLNRAAAVIENPENEIRSHREELVEDLLVAARKLDKMKLEDASGVEGPERREQKKAKVDTPYDDGGA